MTPKYHFSELPKKKRSCGPCQIIELEEVKLPLSAASGRMPAQGLQLPLCMLINRAGEAPGTIRTTTTELPLEGNLKNVEAVSDPH